MTEGLSWRLPCAAVAILSLTLVAYGYQQPAPAEEPASPQTMPAPHHDQAR